MHQLLFQVISICYEIYEFFNHKDIRIIIWKISLLNDI